MSEVRIATRPSPLARAQAKRVADLISRQSPEVELRMVEITTTGDRDRDTDITTLTETGAFVRGIQEAVLDGRADLAVHSLKDLPVAPIDGLELVAFPERESPHDMIVGARLDDLPNASVVGTGSPRRSEQLKAMRPDLRVVGLRGNVDTRLSKVADGELDAAILAEAGLRRLGRFDVAGHRLGIEEMVPAPGQGALAVEAVPESPAAGLARLIDDSSLRTLLEVERELLAKTGAGCRSSLGALATWAGERIRLDLFVSDDRGRRRASVEESRRDEVIAAGRMAVGI